jgi:hypothetical protein
MQTNLDYLQNVTAKWLALLLRIREALSPEDIDVGLLGCNAM